MREIRFPSVKTNYKMQTVEQLNIKKRHVLIDVQLRVWHEETGKLKDVVSELRTHTVRWKWEPAPTARHGDEIVAELFTRCQSEEHPPQGG